MGTGIVELVPRDPAAAPPRAARFWEVAHQHRSMSERDRVQSIKTGFSMDWAEAAKAAFQVTTDVMSRLLNLSTATYDRRRRDKKPLDIVGSERLDRIISIALLAEQVFEDQEAALQWVTTPNKALEGDAPLQHCDTEIGARQVRRILNALEWGGVV